jgi:hypothetical protein
MKLLRLKITDPKGFRSLQAGFEYHFRTEWDLQEENGFAPIFTSPPIPQLIDYGGEQE